jgi:hypothetical protein
MRCDAGTTEGGSLFFQNATNFKHGSLESQNYVKSIVGLNNHAHDLIPSMTIINMRNKVLDKIGNGVVQKEIVSTNQAEDRRIKENTRYHNPSYHAHP